MHELIRNAAWVLSFLISGLWVTIGLLLAGIGWSALWKWFVSARWPQVPARIVASEVKAAGRLEEQRMYQPVVRYAFSAEGQELSGDQLAFVGRLYASESRARQEIDKFPAGMVVMARCHPQDPTEVILKRSGALTGFSLLLLGLGLTAAPLAVAGWCGLSVWPLVAIVGTIAAFAALLDRSSRRRLLRARLAGLYPAKGQGRDGDVERLLHQGEKMLAIRLYRELYGTDLKTARRRVEELEQKLGAGF
jgi:hypothetical protein